MTTQLTLHGHVALRNTRGELLGWTLVDDDTAELLDAEGITCRLTAEGKVVAFGQPLARLVLGLGPGRRATRGAVIAAHLNGDGLDNRRANLEAVPFEEGPKYHGWYPDGRYRWMDHLTDAGLRHVTVGRMYLAGRST